MFSQFQFKMAAKVYWSKKTKDHRSQILQVTDINLEIDVVVHEPNLQQDFLLDKVRLDLAQPQSAWPYPTPAVLMFALSGLPPQHVYWSY